MAAKEADWTCTYCDNENRPSRDQCKTCGEARSADAPDLKSLVASAFQRSSSHIAKSSDYSENYGDRNDEGDARPMNRR